MLRLRPKAIADLEAIADYTLEMWGEEQEQRYLSLFEQAFKDISKNPFPGRPCDYIEPSFRKYLCGRHAIFYQLPDSRVDVVRILHQSMDVNLHFE